MHRLLLLLPLLAHALVAARGEGSGAGSGDGSAYEERCREPVPLPEPLGGSLDIGGKMEPRCHLLCTEKIAMQKGINLEDLVSTTYAAWPMIPNSVLEKNCTIYKMVAMCRESCALRTHGQCQRKCENETCDSPDISDCQICNQENCLLGCEVMQELKVISNETHGIPPDPVDPLDLIIADGFDDSPHTSDAGLYTIDPRNAVPNTGGSRFPTIITIRVARTGAKKSKYMWIASFEEILNLTAYACNEVKIQIGAINKFGPAPGSHSFRSSLTIDVYGGIYNIYARS
jgi:hypothetical protein